jgi:hypothetical protein
MLHCEIVGSRRWNKPPLRDIRTSICSSSLTDLEARMTKAEELARADLLVSDGVERILRLSANLDRPTGRGLPGSRLSLQVLATMRESLHLMVRHRDLIRREASKKAASSGR